MKKISMKLSEATLEEMCTDKFKRDFTNLLRSRYPLFYITHNEESRLVRFFGHYCRVKGYDCYTWNSYEGLVSLVSGEEVTGLSEEIKNNPLAILDHIISKARGYEKKKTSVEELKKQNINGVIFVLLDYFRFIEDDPYIERRFKAMTNLNSIVQTIVTGPYFQTTDVLTNLMPVLDFPRTNRKEIRHALYDVVKGAEKGIAGLYNITKEMEEELINSVSGLTLVEAQTALSKSLVDDHTWDFSIILEEKKQAIRKSGMLEYFDQRILMEDVGGLKNLIEWIRDRKRCFSEEAEKYGLRKPRGLLTIGMPGCVTSETKIKIKKISKEGNLKVYKKI